MSTLDKAKVKLHFDRGAATYDQYAVIQAEMAEKLAGLLPDRSFGRVLEIGCGTGLLTGQLLRQLPDTMFTLVDLSGAMLARTEARLGHLKANIRFIEADAEQWAADESDAPQGAPFDLLVSGASVQWFEQPAVTLTSLTRLLVAQGGTVLFSTFGPQTFGELHEAFRLAEKKLMLPHLPHGRTMVSVDDWQRAFRAAGMKPHIHQEIRVLRFPNTREFLRSIQRVGAGHAERIEGSSLGGRALICAMEEAYEANFADEMGIRVTYHILYGIVDT